MMKGQRKVFAENAYLKSEDHPVTDDRTEKAAERVALRKGQAEENIRAAQPIPLRV